MTVAWIVRLTAPSVDSHLEYDLYVVPDSDVDQVHLLLDTQLDH